MSEQELESSNSEDEDEKNAAQKQKEIAKLKQQPGFKKCKIKDIGSGSIEVECELCGFTRRMTHGKMVFGHYLREDGYDVKVKCVAINILERDHKDFYDELCEKRRERDSKRLKAATAQGRKQRRQDALDTETDQPESTEAETTAESGGGKRQRTRPAPQAGSSSGGGKDKIVPWLMKLVSKSATPY